MTRIPPSPDRTKQDRDFVARLSAGDSPAWASVQNDIVVPLFRADIRGIASQCARVGLDADAVFSRLYANLSRDDFAPLRAFRFECAFSSWLYWHVWNAAQGAIRETTGKLGMARAALDDSEPQIGQNPSPAVGDFAEAIGEANHLLARLWDGNPGYALVLVLRNAVGLSAKEVGSLMGKKPANVDQINHRAQSRMRTLREASRRTTT